MNMDPKHWLWIRQKSPEPTGSAIRNPLVYSGGWAKRGITTRVQLYNQSVLRSFETCLAPAAETRLALPSPSGGTNWSRMVPVLEM